MKQQQLWCDAALPFAEARRAWHSRACYRPHTHPTFSIGAVNVGRSILGVAGVWMFVAVLAWDCLVSWLFTPARMRAVFNKQQALLNRGSAWVLFGIAGGMVWSLI